VPRSYSVALNQSVADRSRIEAIANQSAASWSHASLSSGLKALSAARRHSSALARYSSDLGIGRTLPNAARTRMGPRGPKLPNAVTASLFKRDHPQIQKGPEGMERGQYPQFQREPPQAGGVLRVAFHISLRA
jgi:hypothetical protein